MFGDSRSIAAPVLRLLVGACLVIPSCVGLAIADDEGQAEGKVVVGVQDTRVDADQDRDAKFEERREEPSGLVLDFLQWTWTGDKSAVQFKIWDASQRDERLRGRAAFGDHVRLRFDYTSMPYLYSTGAKFPLADGGLNAYGPTFRIADFVQQAMEDPDGNGVPFFTSGAETAGDNALVQSMTRDLFTGVGTRNIATLRRRGHAGLTWRPTPEWRFDVDVTRETRKGAQPLGSGTYQRTTDVNGDGTTDYDYFFSVRGIELPGPVDYETMTYEARANYARDNWFIDLAWMNSEFDNRYLGVTYDNPFWFNGVAGTSGSRRGLWEEGRASLEPSNESWHGTLSGGINLAHNTRITAAVTLGENTQNDLLMPITTNPAVVGTADINRDGTINAQDNPLLPPGAIPGLPATIDGAPVIGRSLDASSDITAYNLQITSRPTKNLKLTGRFRSYEYEGTEGIKAIPARTEYIESQVEVDWKGDTILHVPQHFKRDTIDLEAAYRFNRNFKLKGFVGRKSYDYDVFRNTDAAATRDEGSRAVSGTTDDTFGVTAQFQVGDWLSGRATVLTASRDFDGNYTIGASGENPGVRQFDIANRDRDGIDVQLDFLATPRLTFGVGYRGYDDDYPDSAYGYLSGETSGTSLNVNWAGENGVAVFAYADFSQWDLDTHGRTKCANCSTPAGFAPWDVPNYDWFTNYKDDTTAFGGGVSWGGNGPTRIELRSSYVKGKIEQKTRNPGTPVELNPANPLFGQTAFVALGYDFPDQENSLWTGELRVTHQLNDQLAIGVWWLYENFDLTDFQVDDLTPYGADFLTVDDATRYLFLDSRFSDYSANILQVFLKARF